MVISQTISNACIQRRSLTSWQDRNIPANMGQPRYAADHGLAQSNPTSHVGALQIPDQYQSGSMTLNLVSLSTGEFSVCRPGPQGAEPNGMSNVCSRVAITTPPETFITARISRTISLVPCSKRSYGTPPSGRGYSKTQERCPHVQTL